MSLKKEMKMRVNILQDIRLKVEKELAKMKERFEDNLLYKIQKVKIIDIKPVSVDRISELSNIVGINVSKDSEKERKNNYNTISDHLKRGLKKSIENRRDTFRQIKDKKEHDSLRKKPKKRNENIRGKTMITEQVKNLEKRIKSNTNRWERDHEKLLQEIKNIEDDVENEINQSIKSIDENLVKFYNIADFLVSLQWRLKPKKGTVIALDPKEKKRKTILNNYKIESYSLYNLEHGIIYDTFITQLPKEVSLEKKEIIESKGSHNYSIKYQYVIWGTGWRWWGPFPYLADVKLIRLYYNINVKYISEEFYSDSTTPKSLELVINFDHSWQQLPDGWWYIAYPITVVGKNGSLPSGAVNPIIGNWGNKYVLKFESLPKEDYFAMVQVEYFDGQAIDNFISASFGEYVGIGLPQDDVNPLALCNTDNSIGQEIQVNIKPYIYPWGILTGVFHRFGYLKVYLEAIASEANKKDEVGKIYFLIPHESYYYRHNGFWVTTKRITESTGAYTERITNLFGFGGPSATQLNPIFYPSYKGYSEILFYTRYPGIKSPNYAHSLSKQVISPSETTELYLNVKNRSKKVNLENLEIEVVPDNVLPYLRPIDGDFTKPDNNEEKTIEPNQYREFSWTLQVPPEMRDQITESITLTPKLNIIYKYGYPVPSTQNELQDNIDCPSITINPS